MNRDPGIFRDRFFWFSILCGGFFLSLTLWYGLGMDQAIYAYGAWVWKVYHLPPYIGEWDGNYPGIFLIHRFEMALFGESILGFRIFDWLIQLGNLALIFYLARKLTGSSRAATLAALFYSFYYLGRGRWDAGQRDAFVFDALLLALFLAVVLEKRIVLRATLVGLCAGFAFLIRPTYGLSWLVFGVLFLVQGIRLSKKISWAELAVYAAGCVLPALAVIAYYFHRGYLHDLYDALIVYSFQVYAPLRPPEAPRTGLGRMLFVAGSLFGSQVLVALLAFFSLLLKRRGEDRSGGGTQIFSLSLALIAVCVLSYLVMGKTLQYQLIPFWGFMILVSSVAVAAISKTIEARFPGARGGVLASAFFLFLILLAFASVPRERMAFALRAPFHGIERAYLTGVNPTDQLLSTNHYLAAQYLKERMGPGDGVEVFGAHPLIPYLLKKKNPSRFGLVQQLLFCPDRSGLHPLQKQWIGEYTEAVIKARPRFFVLADQDIWFPTCLSQPNFRTALAERFLQLNAYLQENYRLVGKVGATEIYELKSAPAPWANPNPGP